MKRRQLLSVFPLLLLSRFPSQLAATIPPLTLQLDWKFNAQFAGVLLADYRGYYRDAGLQVKVNPWESGLDLFAMVTRDQFTIACCEQDQLLNAQAEGYPVTAIAAMLQTSPLGLMSRPDTPLNSLQNLQGKTIGVHNNGKKILHLITDLQGLGEDSIKVKVIEIPYKNKIKRLLSGELDAIQCYTIDEPIGLEVEQKIAPNVLKFSNFGYQEYAQVIFAHNHLIQQYPQALNRFLRATFQGWENAFIDIYKTAQILINYYINPDRSYYNLAYQTQSLQGLREYVIPLNKQDNLGEIDPKRWELMSKRLADYQLVSKFIPVEKSISNVGWVKLST
ncbi:ABC transporter substrate-binding protein [Spirulina sp. CS-785/01]|uniref:ABC transporter substrate-binding protein n=1 Tax=Spirulina sp. CS-785/01 TaxID=3021716 RepID=UPI0023301972|nr:ABC transporter substrate-binding protein [Spirulina sp. CS-785/01]MDB9313766.1 ABC transporter substrate-binding protein [Spirulina sp. CS-785/01]